MRATSMATSGLDADTEGVQHIDYVVDWDAPDIPLASIPCIDRLLEYCDALAVVLSSDGDGMPEDARQSMVTLVGEMHSYIEGVMAAEIDEICEAIH